MDDDADFFDAEEDLFEGTSPSLCYCRLYATGMRHY